MNLIIKGGGWRWAFADGPMARESEGVQRRGMLSKGVQRERCGSRGHSACPIDRAKASLAVRDLALMKGALPADDSGRHVGED